MPYVVKKSVHQSRLLGWAWFPFNLFADFNDERRRNQSRVRSDPLALCVVPVAARQLAMPLRVYLEAESF
jgi:hypothetical protein